MPNHSVSADSLRNIREIVEFTKPDNRPSFDYVFLSIAELFRMRGTCPRRRVGAVLVNPSQHIIATGYNGSPKGQPHCSEVGCLMDGTGIEPGTGRCKRTTHAEQNALLQCALHQTSPKGATLYTTAFPCSECANLLVTAEISRVVYTDEYNSQSLGTAVTDLFQSAGITVERFPV